MINALIVEDEEASKEYLEKLLENSKIEIKLIGGVSSIESTIKWLNHHQKPDIIFMDIHLTDGNSLDIFERINIKVPVIFVTAYDQYAVRAFKTSGIDYLIKPISPHDLKLSLNKFLKNKLTYYHDYSYELNELIYKSKEYKERFLVTEGNQFIPIKTIDIAYFFIMHKVVLVRMFNGKSYMINFSLGQIEELVSPHIFIRVNRSILANINSIGSLIKKDSDYYISLIPFHEKGLKVSRLRYSEIKDFLS